MRVTTLASAIVATTIPVISAFAGCGGSVSVASSGTGGAGGHATTVSNTTSSVSGPSTAVVSAVSSSSTAGGGGSGGYGEGRAAPAPRTPARPATRPASTPRAAGSTSVRCSGSTARTVSPMYDCILTCLDSAQCSQLQQQAFACYQMCQNMGNDGGPPPFDAGPPPFDGGPALSCAQCLGGSCQQQSFACVTDMAPGGCFGWSQCEAACYQASPIDPACFSNCDAMFPNAAAKYDAVYACACGSCGTACAASEPCNHGADGG